MGRVRSIIRGNFFLKILPLLIGVFFFVAGCGSDNSEEPKGPTTYHYGFEFKVKSCVENNITGKGCISLLSGITIEATLSTPAGDNIKKYCTTDATGTCYMDFYAKGSKANLTGTAYGPNFNPTGWNEIEATPIAMDTPLEAYPRVNVDLKNPKWYAEVIDDYIGCWHVGSEGPASEWTCFLNPNDTGAYPKDHDNYIEAQEYDIDLNEPCPDDPDDPTLHKFIFRYHIIAPPLPSYILGCKGGKMLTFSSDNHKYYFCYDSFNDSNDCDYSSVQGD